MAMLSCKRSVIAIAVAATVVVVSTAATGQIAENENPFENAGSDRGTQDVPRPVAKPEFLIRMTKADCRRLIRRAEVPGPNYVPGVDAHGNPVAPAELPGAFTARELLPEEIAFELAFNPLSYAGNPDLAEIFRGAETSLGQVRYSLSSGALTLNGKRLNEATEAEILAFCRASLGE
jgi:hypothetical protein